MYEIESGKPSLYSDRLFGLLRLLGARVTIEASVDGTDSGDSADAQPTDPDP